MRRPERVALAVHTRASQRSPLVRCSPVPMPASHPIQRRFHAEDLIRLRRAGEQRRYLASQRAGRVDPNAHQIDAVIFALQRIPQGGCILADEVGLGKTIEAGLVMAQLRAEGAARILLITPKPLLGQWQQELSTLFAIEAREGAVDPGGFEGPGVFLVGREYAGSERGSHALLQSGAFDLAIIDEAHEMFAGIYRRHDGRGRGGVQPRYAKTAARVKQTLQDTPVLLLTATPIQNTLTELWGLVQYVEPTGTLLGDLPTFRSVFCEGDDRRLRPGQDEELRRRIATVCQRTLRRQAQEFMQRKFVRRSARLFAYTMSPEEHALYEDVTTYLQEPDLFAFGGVNRRLLVIGFHRRMGSSVRALADSLDAVAARLERRLRGDDTASERLWGDDLDDETEGPEREDGDAPEHERHDASTSRAKDDLRTVASPKATAELARVRSLAARARALPRDTKAEQLVLAVRFVTERAERGEGTGKLVIFTEALSTQTYLCEILVASGLVHERDVTLFRGQNTGSRAHEALARWDEEVGTKIPPAAQPSRAVAMRLALVHEFETRSRIFIATEAGAKGLNLQCCENVVNYDLPWNPQRIEQRIGRCHRYGQTHDVTVINFLAHDNAAERLTFEILSRKLELFGNVLDASDAVLHEASTTAPPGLASALAGELEQQLERVYAQARSAAEIEAGLDEVGHAIDEARTELAETYARTAGLIETRFDETVRSAFRALERETSEGLAAFDRDLEGVVLRFLEAQEIPFEREERDGRARLRVAADPRHPPELQAGLDAVIGHSDALTDAEPLHLGHRVIRAAVDEARRATDRRFDVRITSEGSERGRGRLVVLKIGYAGYEPTVELVPVAVLRDAAGPERREHAVRWLEGEIRDREGPSEAVIDDAIMNDAIEEALFVAQADVDAREHVRFEEAIARIERYMEDRILVLVRARAELDERLLDARARRDAATGAETRTRAEAECLQLQDEIDRLTADIDRLHRRDDPDYETWRARAHERRYAPPRIERILDAEIELA